MMCMFSKPPSQALEREEKGAECSTEGLDEM